MSRRLLFIVNQADYFLSHRRALAEAAQRCGWQVEIATAPDKAQEAIRRAGFTVHSLPLSRSGLRPDRELTALLATWRLLRRRRPALVHCVALKATVLGGLASRLAGVPARVLAIAGLGHVFTDQGAGNRLLQWCFGRLIRLLAGPGTRLLLQNEEDLAQMAAFGVPSRRLVLIPGAGVDPARFHPEPEPPGPVAVLLPSRMIWKKGIGEFVEAARLLRGRGVEARFCLAGDVDPGNPASVPRAQLAAWDDEGIVEWHGFVQDMPALLASSHIVCLPSYYGEGVPKSLIEGAAAGRPLVSTDMPGCRAIARDGENAILVPPQDARALADTLQRLIEDPALRQRLGTRGREIAKGEFAQAKVVKDTLALYRELMP